MKIEQLMKNYKEKKDYSPRLKINTFISVEDIIDLITIDLKESAIIVNDNGTFAIDHVFKTLTMDLFFIRKCSNIELDISSVIEQYNFLKEKNLISLIKKTVREERKEEYEELIDMCNKSLKQEIEIRNSIEGIIATGIQGLLEKVPNEKGLLKIADSIKNVDSSKFKMIKDLFSFSKEITNIGNTNNINDINDTSSTPKTPKTPKTSKSFKAKPIKEKK